MVFFSNLFGGRKLPAATEWCPSGGRDRAEVWSCTDPPSWKQTVSHTQIQTCIQLAWRSFCPNRCIGQSETENHQNHQYNTCLFEFTNSNHILLLLFCSNLVLLGFVRTNTNKTAAGNVGCSTTHSKLNNDRGKKVNAIN